MDVVTLGEAMVLLAATEPGPLDQAMAFSKHTAGAETNVAVGLARMGLRVGWISRLGDDAGGRYLQRCFEREGIDCAHAPLVPGERTGLMFKSRSDDGSDPVTEYLRQGSAASQLGPQHLDLAWMIQARHLHASGVFAALGPGPLAALQRTMQAMREAGKSVSFDPNLRPALWPDVATMRETLNALALQADLFLPGQAEGELLCGLSAPAAIAQHYRDLGVSRVVVKCGAQGAWYADAQGSGWIAARPVARVVDTVGAGDAFAAGVVSGVLEGLALDAAVRRGHWTGACAVQVRGDSEGLPTRAQWRAAGVD